MKQAIWLQVGVPTPQLLRYVQGFPALPGNMVEAVSAPKVHIEETVPFGGTWDPKVSFLHSEGF